MSGNVTIKQQQVINYITNLIEEKNLSMGEKIDTEVNIAKILDVTRTTVREATRHLLDEGLVYRVRKSGLHVGSSERNINLTGKFNVISHFDYQAKKQGYKGSRKVLSASIVPVPNEQIANSLGLKRTDFVYKIVRLMFFDDIPVSIEFTLIPTNLFNQFEFSQLEISKFGYIEEMTGKKVKKRIQNIMAINIDDEKVETSLNVDKNKALLKLEEITYLEDDTPCEHNVSYIKAEYHPIQNIIERRL
ncbi:hypothetical protein A9G11_10280 [Gilliamella sp. wkB108]|uniref:GntR family transcriptional regulator n=1 Tax=Gilliamella sp. wkB108 TaxID=3120256 RepID=UPI00080E95BF|nr:GntR family transcriptional regulator [Gilliamella apicola]OCG28605.1 hypothetical protein A9G11_10280 [Gilliamella apicola]